MKTNVGEILRQLAAANNGLLTPEKVVAYAKPASSPLHSRFTWDNTKAAREYRLWEARQLISVSLTLIRSGDEDTPIRAFVNLTTDRRKGGGYRELSVVMADKSMREQLLADALLELQVFQIKYQQLSELAQVFSEADRLRNRKPQPRRSNQQPARTSAAA